MGSSPFDRLRANGKKSILKAMTVAGIIIVLRKRGDGEIATSFGGKDSQ
jgi:hypothetical protein